MNLAKLMTKKRLTVLGLNSGTSADGIDAAVVRISRRDGKLRTKCLHALERKMPQVIRDDIFRLCDGSKVELDDIIRLEQALGALFGRIARDVCRRAADKRIRVDLVASHGQTIRHLPEKARFAGGSHGGTMQLGSLDRIAAATGTVTVGDFRQADVALGGEGAPITTGAMRQLFASPDESRLIVNIGGMSNYFYLAAGREAGIARDCGPGNAICDELARELLNKKYDRDGRVARRGTIVRPLLRRLLADPFFSKKSRSTGRESFGTAKAQRMIAYGRRNDVDACDLLATATELTAVSTARSVQPILRRRNASTKLYLTGGGRHNSFLVCRLSHHLPEAEILPVDKLGIDGDFVEAVAYAVMGEAALRGVSLSSAGHGRRAILGRIVQPPMNLL